MKSNDISVSQAKQLMPHVNRSYLFIRRLLERMDKRRFESNDPYYQAVRAAEESLHRLQILTFYMTVENGVGDRPRRVK